MPGSNQSSQPTYRLADRLAAARHGRFVGREAELEFFRSALVAEEPLFAVLYLYGPGGIGKTTLLREYVRMAQASGRAHILLDSRNVDPSPTGFQRALQMGLNLSKGQSLFAAIPPGFILLIDTYEMITPLDSWLRNEFLPQLPPSVFVVLAGRKPPGSAWRTDPGWATLTRLVSLRNLGPEESQALLTVRGIPEEQHAHALAFTHGHPLALSLVADLLKQGDQLVAFTSRANADVVRILLDRFTQNVPDSQHRQALEICAHVRVTTESLLTDVLDLGREAAQRLFTWLRGLSFIEPGFEGIFPHDLAREVLDADLRWRNPQGYRMMNRQVRKYFDKLMQETEGSTQRMVMTDITYLYRHNPVTKSYYNWEAFGDAYTELASPEDHAIILEMVQHHEGTASAEIARYWLKHQPEAFTMFRSNEDRVIGFMAMLTLAAITPIEADTDPAVAAAQRYLRRHGPLRTDEEFDFVRFWMGREKYQVAEYNNLVTEVAGTAFRTGGPRRAWSFVALADPDYWQPFFAHLNFAYTQEADFTVAGRRFGVFTHDWRVEPVSVWGRMVAERQLAAGTKMAQPATTSRALLVVLSEPEFTKAVRQALRDYTRPDLLAANLLLRSRLVIETAEQETSVATLQSLLQQAAATLTGNPRDEKFYRAVYHTYLKPALTQEAAAELLGLPLGTYRYRLARGIERITEWLWQRELQDFKT